MKSIIARAELNGEGVSPWEIQTLPPITPALCKEVHAMLEANYGKEYSQQRMDMLFALATERGWSGARLMARTKEFIAKHKWEAWTIADFLNEDTGRLYPWSWVLSENTKNPGCMAAMEGFRIPGVKGGLWRYYSPSNPTLPYLCIHGPNAVQIPKAEERKALPEAEPEGAPIDVKSWLTKTERELAHEEAERKRREPRGIKTLLNISD